jgi:hypothetical protein
MIHRHVVHWLLAGTLATSQAFTGCSSSEQSNTENPETSGSVQLQLQATEGVLLDTVDYLVTGPGNFEKSGSFDLTHSNTLTGRIDAIPLASGYTIKLDAIGRDNSATCSASKDFDVVSTGKTTVAISLQCKLTHPQRTGEVLVNGAINICPFIESATASVTEINVGFPLDLSSSGTDPDAGPQPLSYSWTASSGTLSDPNVPNPTFTCTEVGEATLTLTLSDGDSCPDTRSFSITCSKPVGQPEPKRVTFGIFADTHVTPQKPDELARLAKGFAFFDSVDADTVVVDGDLTDFGSQAEYDAWKSVKDAYIGDRRLIACLGNHEGNTADRLLAATGNKPNDDQVVNGYHFITISAGAGPLDPVTGKGSSHGGGNYTYVLPWLKERLDAAVAEDPDKPIFLFRHYPLNDTIYASTPWGGSGLTTAFLANYPQVVTFSGHIHTPNNHPRSIWQDGGFTAVNVPTLTYLWMEPGMVYGEVPPDAHDFAGVTYVEVEGTKVTIKNYDLLAEQYVPQTWTFDTSKPDEFPYTAARDAAAKAPVFPATAAVRVSEITDTTVTLSFDQAVMQANGIGDIVDNYRYDFVERATGNVLRTFKTWSEFYQLPRPATLTWQATGLTPNTAQEIRIYATDAFHKTSTAYISAQFTTTGGPVIPETPSVTLSADTYKPGDAISVSFKGAKNSLDWIGIYYDGQVPGSVSSLFWFYVGGSHTAGALVPSGTLVFNSANPGSNAGTWPPGAGNYRVYLLADDGYEIRAQASFKIQP